MVKLLTKKGYYCGHCDAYIPEDKMRRTYSFEVLGRWDGVLPQDVQEDMYCPACREGDELEEFYPLYWSHLRAYCIEEGDPIVFMCPVFDRATNGVTTGWEQVDTIDEVERLSDWYCIEVVRFTEDNGKIVAWLEFC